MQVVDGARRVYRATVHVRVRPQPPRTPAPPPVKKPLPTPPPGSVPPPIRATAGRVDVQAGSEAPVTLPRAVAQLSSIDGVSGAPDLSALLGQGGLAVAATAAAHPRAVTLAVRGRGCTAPDDCNRQVQLTVPVTVTPLAAPPGPLETFSDPSPDREAAAEPTPSGGGLRLTDELLVTLGTPDTPGTRDQAAAAADAVGAVVSGGLDDVGVYELRWSGPQDLAARRDQLLAQPGVTDVTDSTAGDSEADATQPPGDWDDDGPATTWPFEQVRAPVAWDTDTGTAATVGVIDVGTVFAGHEDLHVVKTLGPTLPQAHATHVAGLACAKANGIGLVGLAWGCPIVTASRGDKWSKNLVQVADAMARTPGVEVVNISLGHESGCVDADTAAEWAKAADQNKGAFRHVFAGVGKNLVWTISAGNNCAAGIGAAQAANFDLPNVITVAATNAGGALASFSNFGHGVEVAAPGGVGAGIAGGADGVWSTMVKACGFLWTKYCSAYGQMAGTSMAAPEVAGIAALVRAEHPGFTAAQVAACITDTAGSGPAGIASFRSDLPTSFKPKIPYEPTTLPIVDAPNAVACTGRPPAATDALVVGTGDFGDVNADDNLTSLLTNAGYHVTETQSLPDDLTPYDSLWYVSTDPLSTDDGIRIAQFAKSGHGVFLTGERPCCEALNAWDSAIVNQLVVSVGGVTVGGLGDPFYDTGDVTIHADAASDVAQKPNMLSTWRVSAPGGLDNVASQNVFADASGVPVAAVWGSADVIGSGRLALLMDVNWLEDGYWDPVSAKSIVENLALFLSGASQPPAAPAGRATAVRRATSRSHTPSAAGP